jgi:hypothetical protein
MGGSAMAIDGETANSGALVAAPRNMLTCARPVSAQVLRTLARVTRGPVGSREYSRHTHRDARAPTAHEHQREHAPVRTPGQRTQTCACTHTHTHTHTHTQASLKWDQWKRHTPLLYDMLINNNLTHPSPCVHWGHRVSDDAERSTQVCPPVCSARLPAGRMSCGFCRAMSVEM